MLPTPHPQTTSPFFPLRRATGSSLEARLRGLKETAIKPMSRLPATAKSAEKDIQTAVFGSQEPLLRGRRGMHKVMASRFEATDETFNKKYKDLPRMGRRSLSSTDPSLKSTKGVLRHRPSGRPASTAPTPAWAEPEMTPIIVLRVARDYRRQLPAGLHERPVQNTASSQATPLNPSAAPSMPTADEALTTPFRMDPTTLLSTT